MLKFFIHILFSLVLSFSILAPSVVNLFNGEEKYVFINDANDDENKTEYKTNLEEKDLISYDIFNFFINFEKEKNKVSGLYIPSHSDLELKIILPPPEHSI
ncbi:hypothetical protein [Abyssalbus ytuae]|uniref:Uncharacterized protein n=1 Tax=Abyssalbus ytuae TaxID=2926907 RepID=A0A9E7A3J2_9FLAO|nr:hypothetical protein [Abyssalbus ytuae]UOB19221.1 hypothetical protein MQE35_07955 [Abyssalbus ytuae]